MRRSFTDNRTQVCAEIDEPATKELLTAMRYDGSIVQSNKLNASVLAMVMMSHDVVHILDAFFNPENENHIIIRPADRYIQFHMDPGPNGVSEICFWDVVALCRRKNELLLGTAIDTDKGLSIELNPKNKGESRPLSYWGKFYFVVLSHRARLKGDEMVSGVGVRGCRMDDLKSPSQGSRQSNQIQGMDHKRPKPVPHFHLATSDTLSQGRESGRQTDRASEVLLPERQQSARDTLLQDLREEEEGKEF